MRLSDVELGVHERRMIFSDDACEVSAVSLESSGRVSKYKIGECMREAL